MMHRCLPTIICYLLCCNILELLHRVCLPKRGCWLHCLSLFSSKNQKTCVLFFHGCWIICWSEVFCSSSRFRCCLLYWCFPINLTPCGHIWHTCYILPWRTCKYCCSIYFLLRLTLELSFLVWFSIVFISIYLCPSEPIYICIQVLKWNIRYADITGYSHRLVVFM